ncbi:MAG: hypothetical protein U0M48_03610, partial [Xylanibacter rarus]
HIYRFQIINLLFMSQNSATFDAKVAEFSVANKWLFLSKSDISGSPIYFLYSDYRHFVRIKPAYTE